MYIQQCYPPLADILWRGGGGGEIKQIQLKCLAKRKHSVKNKVKFSPNPQDEPYLITSFKSLVVSA